MPEEIQIETRPQPKFALLDFGEYLKLNKQLSELSGWQLGQPTERSFEMNKFLQLRINHILLFLLLSTAMLLASCSGLLQEATGPPQEAKSLAVKYQENWYKARYNGSEDF